MRICDFDPTSLSPGAKHTLALDITPMPDGLPLRLTLLAAVGAAPGPTVVLLAGVHGDEYEGILAIPEVMRRLDPAALRGTVLAVPVCNVPAYLTATRASPLDGLNLARVFPGDPDGSVTPRLAYWLAQRVIAHADLLIDLHSAGTFYSLPPLCGYYAGAGDAGRRSREIALAFGLPVVWGHPDVAPGRSVSFATDRGIPWVYTEAPGAGRVRPEDFDAFVTGVLNSLKVMGMLDGAPDTTPIVHDLWGDGNLDLSIPAPAGGLFVSQVGLLQAVRRGERLGEVRDLAGETLAVIDAPGDGVVISLRGLPRVHPGDGLYALTQRRPEGMRDEG